MLNGAQEDLLVETQTQIAAADTKRIMLLTVRGEIDVSTVEEFRQALEKSIAGGTTLIVHLDVDYFDAQGVGALVYARRIALKRGASIALVCSKRATRVIRIIGLNTKFNIYGTVEEAVQAIS